MKTLHIGFVAAAFLVGGSTLALAQATSGGAASGGSGSGISGADNQMARDPGLGASAGIGTVRGTDRPTQDKGAGSRFESSDPPGPIDPSGINGGLRPNIPTR